MQNKTQKMNKLAKPGKCDSFRENFGAKNVSDKQPSRSYKKLVDNKFLPV